MAVCNLLTIFSRSASDHSEASRYLICNSQAKQPYVSFKISKLLPDKVIDNLTL